ncbi:MAG: hypothetical protein QG657_4920, partial [Acidobacteriota bacterium]|nr:hypothetical protein [Acidobacteriota bacterium]
DDRFLDLLRQIIFKDYKEIDELKGDVAILRYISEKSVAIILLEISLKGSDAENDFELIRFIAKLKKKTNIIIISEASEKQIEEHTKDIDQDQIYIFDKTKVANDTEAIRKTIESIIEKLNSDTLYVDDRWILMTLEKSRGFQSFGFQFTPFFHDEILEDEMKDFEKNDYTIWFSKLYDEIISKRFKIVFDTSKFEYIIPAMENLIWLERISYITPFFSSRKRYRDHFLHQLRIAVLGDFLLDTYLDENTKLIDYINAILRDGPDTFPDFIGNDPEREIKKCRITWWITALMHDYAYPLHLIFDPILFDPGCVEKMKKGFIEDFFNPFLDSHKSTKEEFVRSFKEKLTEFLEAVKIDEKYRANIFEHLNVDISHNITSAFNLWQLQKNQKEKNENFCIGLACQSILLHHPFGESRGKSISFNKYPLAFLLTLLDEIQDWGRPTLITDDQKDPTAIKKAIDLNKIEIKGIFQKGKKLDRWYFDDKKITITLDYSKNNNVKPEHIKGISDSKTKNLSRLHIGSENLPEINVQLKFTAGSSDIIQIKRREK